MAYHNPVPFRPKGILGVDPCLAVKEKQDVQGGKGPSGMPGARKGGHLDDIPPRQPGQPL